MAAQPGTPAGDGLDGVEIKLNFDAAQIDDALRLFGLGADAGKPRRIWFGEILDGAEGAGALPLLGRGVIVRIRAKQKSGDVTIKLRGPDGGIDPKAWRAGAGGSSDAKLEGDWAGKRLVSASLGHDFGQDGVQEMDAAQPSIGRLLSAEQDSLAAQMLVPQDHVRLLGPIQAQKWEAEGDVEAELWEVDGLRFLEISLLVTQDPVGARQRLQQRATDGGLDITAAGQETKTTTVLRHLATRHTNAPPA